uniref:Uncharacterized protein n=1 Tax=Meloidogyne incognita TaxID=6306 RepID=A0A914MJL6_MELIC
MFATTNFNFFQVLKEVFWPLIIAILAMKNMKNWKDRSARNGIGRVLKKGIGFMSILVISGTAYVFYVYDRPGSAYRP